MVLVHGLLSRIRIAAQTPENMCGKASADDGASKALKTRCEHANIDGQMSARAGHAALSLRLV